MIRRHEDHKGCFNISDEYMKEVKSALDEYQGRFVVLLENMTTKDERGERYTLEKGTLVKLAIKYESFSLESNSTDSFDYTMSNSIIMSGVCDGKLHTFEPYYIGLKSLKDHMTAHLDNTVSFSDISEQEVAVYSYERCLGYIEEMFGSHESLDDACTPLTSYYNKSFQCEYNLLGPIMLLLGLIFMTALAYVSGHTSLDFAPMVAIILFGLFAAGSFAVSILAFNWKKNTKKLVDSWQNLDNDIAAIVSYVERESSQREVTMERPRLCELTKLLSDNLVVT